MERHSIVCSRQFRTQQTAREHKRLDTSIMAKTTLTQHYQGPSGKRDGKPRVTKRLIVRQQCYEKDYYNTTLNETANRHYVRDWYVLIVLMFVDLGVDGS
jgi:hypothetical protein